MAQVLSGFKVNKSFGGSPLYDKIPRDTLKGPFSPRGHTVPKNKSLNVSDVSSKEISKPTLASILEPVIVPFIKGLGYRPATELDNELLWKKSLIKASSMGVPCPENSANWKRLKVGFSYAHHCYPGHPLDVQTYVAVYTLFAQNLDDFTPEGMQDIEKFYQRLCAGEQQPTNVLQGWAQLMREVQLYWSPMNQVRSGRSWAYYLRNMDGLGDAFATFTFPSSLYPDVSQFLEAIPDMAMYIVNANDIISFYKEELAGEEDNYAHSRARYDGKDIVSTLQDIVGDTEACYRRIRELLSSGGEERGIYAEAWQQHEQGYVDFHMFSGRYKLEELGLKL